MRTVTIDVTADDIAKGKPKEPCDCPIAIATDRAFGGGVAISCGQTLIGINFVDYSLPVPARRFIRRFDDGENVKPFSFSVEVPS